MVSVGHTIQPSRSAVEEVADLARGVLYYGILCIGLGTPLFAFVYDVFLR